MVTTGMENLRSWRILERSGPGILYEPEEPDSASKRCHGPETKSRHLTPTAIDSLSAGREADRPVG